MRGFAQTVCRTTGSTQTFYTYGKFHSTTHECLRCAAVLMDIVIFGNGSERIRVETGDVIVMPADVSHQTVQDFEDNLMIGRFPEGSDWDKFMEEF